MGRSAGVEGGAQREPAGTASNWNAAGEVIGWVPDPLAAHLAPPWVVSDGIVNDDDGLANRTRGWEGLEKAVDPPAYRLRQWVGLQFGKYRRAVFADPGAQLSGQRRPRADRDG